MSHTAAVSLVPIPETTPDPFSLEELAKICPEPVKNTYQRLGEFQFSQTYNYEKKPPVELDNGAIYYGQWKDGVR